MSKYIIITMLASMLMISGSCRNNTRTKDSKNIAADKVVKITYHQCGGLLGVDELLSITEASSLYSYSLYIDSTDNRRSDMPTDPAVWAQLLSELDVETFKKIKGIGSLLEEDVPDIEYKLIMESGEEYSFIHGEEDEHFKKLQPFFNHVQRILNDHCTISKP